MTPNWNLSQNGRKDPRSRWTTGRGRSLLMLFSLIIVAPLLALGSNQESDRNPSRRSFASTSIPKGTSVGGDGSLSDLIQGMWRFVGFQYRDQWHPPLNPDLLLVFGFRSDGSSLVYWTRLNENGFCERRGSYRLLEGNILEDRVTWLNPDNSMDCGKDPDMRLGTVTRTPVMVKENQFFLHLGLGGEPFAYIFDRAGSP